MSSRSLFWSWAEFTLWIAPGCCLILAVSGCLECGQNARGKDGHLNGPSQEKYVDLTKVGFLVPWIVGLKCFSAEVSIPGWAQERNTWVPPPEPPPCPRVLSLCLLLCPFFLHLTVSVVQWPSGTASFQVNWPSWQVYEIRLTVTPILQKGQLRFRDIKEPASQFYSESRAKMAPKPQEVLARVFPEALLVPHVASSACLLFILLLPSVWVCVSLFSNKGRWGLVRGRKDEKEEGVKNHFSLLSDYKILRLPCSCGSG